MLLQVSRKVSTMPSTIFRCLSKRSNPGLGYQLSAIEDADEVLKSDPEGFGDLECDLINAHKSHKQHELDLQKQREKIRQHIIKNKYFRQVPLPNLLTYAEKEQIKFLHSSDKEEWTVEKLAESFPASAETICKILKARWTPMSSKRILSHDATVLKNWEHFKKNEYNEKISVDLHEHLKKFVDRKIKDLNILQDPSKTLQRKDWKKPKSNEFGSIITSLPIKKDNNVTSLSDSIAEQTVKGLTRDMVNTDTYLLGEIRNRKPITIHELKGNQFLKNSGNPTYMEDSKALDHFATQKLKNNTGTSIICNNTTSSSIETSYTEKFISNEVVIIDAESKRYEMSMTKKRIHIPRKLWKKGATYRAKDCYYDDDGEFIYRVPGMNYK